METLTPEEHERFARDIADAIQDGARGRYEELLRDSGSPLKSAEITVDQIKAIHARVHWLVEQENDV